MAGVPIEGINQPADQPPAGSDYSLPPNEGKVKGGFWRTLLGQKHDEESAQRLHHAQWVMETLHQISTGVSQAPPSIIKLLIRESASVFGPEFAGRLKDHFDSQEAAANYEAKRQMLANAQPANHGVPASTEQLAGAPIPSLPIPPQQPQAGTPQQSQVGTPQPPPNAGAILQQLAPMLAQQSGGPSPGAAAIAAAPGPGPGTIPGGPPPFVNGAGAGPGASPAPTGPSPAVAPTPGTVPIQGENDKVRVAAQAGGIGFGGPTAAPVPAATRPAATNPMANFPQPTPGNIFNVGPVQHGVDLAASALPGQVQANALAVQAEQDKLRQAYATRKSMYTGQDWFEHLPEREKAIALTGLPISPEPVRNITGQYIADGVNDRDEFNRLVPEGTLGRKTIENGREVFREEVGPTHNIIIQDPNSPTKWSQISLNRLNKEVGRTAATIPGIYAEQVRRSSRDAIEWKQVGDKWEPFPVSSTQENVVQRNPGSTPPAGAAGAGGKGGAATGGGTTQGAPRGSQPAGASSRTPGSHPLVPVPANRQTAAAWKMDMENQYLPEGAKTMAELMPRMDMLKRVRQQLEPYKNSDIPASSLLESIAYSVGYAGNTGGFLSQLNLGSIAQAGTLIKNVSKSQKVLGEAMIHTPDAWKDSSKMMYQKISEILKNMEDIKKYADQYLRKYPGRDQQKQQPATPPPGLPAPPAGARPNIDNIITG